MSDRRWTWLIVMLAVIARVVAVLVLQSHLIPHSTYEHGEIAANLLAGKGFSVMFLGAFGPTSQQAPIYPFLVAAAYAIGGVGTPNSLLILELGQSLLGGWMVLEVMRLARAIAPGHRVAVIVAGLIAALHPTLVYASTHIQVAPLACALLVASLAHAAEARTIRQACGVGFLLGLLVLTDPILGLVALSAAWLIARNCNGFRPAIRPIASLAATSVLVVAPWIARNYAVHHELVFVKSTFGYAFWQGNCDLSEGTDKVVRASVERKLAARGDSLRSLNESLWAARHEAGYLDDIALTAADYRILRVVSEPERSRILFRRSLFELGKQPGRYMTLCLRRLRYFFLFDETNPKTRSTLYRASHLGLTIAALAGFLFCRASQRRKLSPILLAIALIAAFHTLTIVSSRFHIPIEPLFALAAGLGLTRFSTVVKPAREVEVIDRLRLGDRVGLARAV